MITKGAGVAVEALFAILKGRSGSGDLAAGTRLRSAGVDYPGQSHERAMQQLAAERHRMMAAEIEGRRRAMMSTVTKQQNLDRMRSFTQAQLGIGLAERGMGYNPMLGGGGGGAGSAPFISWAARRG